MDIPQPPKKPNPPKKPKEFLDKVQTVDLSDQDGTSIQEIVEKNFPGIPMSEIIVFNDYNYGSYGTTTLVKTDKIPNPKYAEQKAEYDLKLKNYENGKLMHKVLMEEYKKATKAYSEWVKQYI